MAGELSIEVVTDFPGRFQPGAVLRWRLGAAQKTLTIASVRPHAARLLLRFEGVADVDAARALQGGDLCVPVGDAFPAPDGFFYGHEIRDWLCEDVRGNRLGRVEGLEQTPAGAMLSVETRAGKVVLVPFAHPIVVRVDRATRRIVLDPPEGLLDL